MRPSRIGCGGRRLSSSPIAGGSGRDRSQVDLQGPEMPQKQPDRRRIGTGTRRTTAPRTGNASEAARSQEDRDQGTVDVKDGQLVVPQKQPDRRRIGTLAISASTSHHFAASDPARSSEDRDSRAERVRLSAGAAASDPCPIG